MLKIIILKSRGMTDVTIHLEINAREVKLLSELLVGSWLNTGFRNPTCFGYQPTANELFDIEFTFF
jgi:hypothetical protein